MLSIGSDNRTSSLVFWFRRRPYSLCPTHPIDPTTLCRNYRQDKTYSKIDKTNQQFFLLVNMLHFQRLIDSKMNKFINQRKKNRAINTIQINKRCHPFYDQTNPKLLITFVYLIYILWSNRQFTSTVEKLHKSASDHCAPIFFVGRFKGLTSWFRQLRKEKHFLSHLGGRRH